MKKNKKSKLVLFSVLGLAAISIGTVGFATWVTGVDSRTASDTTKVTVDTSKNKTVIVLAKLSESDNSLVLKEPTSSAESTNLIKVEDGAATDLTVTFSEFRVIVSDSYILNNVNFSLEGTTIDNCLLDESKSSIYPTNIYGTETNTSKLSYLKLGTASYSTEQLKPLTSSDSGYVEGYSCYTLKDSLSYTFKRGTMFGDGTQTPSEYLSACSDATIALGSVDTKLAYIEKCNKMLNAMYTNLHNKTINLTITADVSEAA